MNQTTITKLNNINRVWYMIDVEGMVLGRFSTYCANLLRGKNKPYYVNHLDCGDYVILVNADKIVLTGNKLNTKNYYSVSGYIGGLRTRSAKEMRNKYLIEMVTKSISGMLPKNKLRKLQINRLYVYKGNNHNHEAQKPIELKL